MRLILASAGIVFLATSGSAMAADCTKGLLWPYVRNPGDCLTDVEIQAGKTGVYTGPATGQVDVSTIKPPPQTNAAPPNSVQCSHDWYWPFGSGDCAAAPAATVGNAAASGTAASSPAAKDSSPAGSPAPAVKPQAAATPMTPPSVQAGSPQAVVPQAAATIQVAQTSTAQCQKGFLWPFVRDAGDCATAVEKASGKISEAPVAANASAVVAAAQTCTRSWLWPIVSDTCTSTQAAPVAAMQAVAVATSPAADCSKGTFWPFIRESGDCLTAVERASGKAPAAPIAATEAVAAPASIVMPSPPAPPMQAVAVATSPSTDCSKGAFWPFVRESGDCLTAAERASGKIPAAPIAAAEPPAMPVPAAAPPTSAPATPIVAVASPPAESCTRGTFWPFIRQAGDCPTAAEKASGQVSAAPVAASAPAATPVVQTNTAAAPATPDPTRCERSWLWPFVREPGDCQTSAEKGSTPTSAVPISANGPTAGPVVIRETTAAPEQSAPAQTNVPATTNPASCHKSLFWPFVREAGDCPTDADRAPQHNPS